MGGQMELLKSPLGSSRITEQPRRHGSSARYMRDPMTQGYWPWGACRSCGTIPRKLSRSPGPFLVVSHYSIWIQTTVVTLQIPPVTRGPRASLVQVGCPIAACAFAWHMVNTADFGPRLVDISLVCGNIFSRVVLGRPEPGLPPCSSRNSSMYGPLLSLISPSRPRFCSAVLPNPCWSTLQRGQPSICY